MTGKPNIPLAAIRIGDQLKYRAEINHIDRIASSVFPFQCEPFPPVKGVTSTRATLIYNWLMTLFKQPRIPDAEKQHLVREFLMNVSHDELKPAVLRILVETNILPSMPTEVEDGPALSRAAEAALLNLVFKPEQLQQIGLRPEVCDLLSSRMNEARTCVDAGAYLSAVILVGSVLEGLCLCAGSREPKRMNLAFAEKFKRNVLKLPDWKLSEWIDVLAYVGDLTPNVQKFGHAVKDFRNYVHPYAQIASGFRPDKNTAEISYHVVIAAIDDLAAAAKRQSG